VAPDGEHHRSDAPPAGFERLGEEVRHDGHVVRLVHGRYRAPDGQRFERDLVRHPGAVNIVPVHDDGTVTLIRQLRPSVWEAVLESPAGTCDVDGEPPEETARRELAEEAGLAAEQVRRLAVVYNSPGITDQRTILYLATGLSPCDTGRSGIEEQWMQTETVRLVDVGRLVAEGRLRDATTILGLLLARDALAGDALAGDG
jgi:8-oxo-dGTP pyrophosphatase MutT (NUDIX family)